jgi:hypothetical protein
MADAVHEVREHADAACREHGVLDRGLDEHAVRYKLPAVFDAPQREPVSMRKAACSAASRSASPQSVEVPGGWCWILRPAIRSASASRETNALSGCDPPMRRLKSPRLESGTTAATVSRSVEVPSAPAASGASAGMVVAAGMRRSTSAPGRAVSRRASSSLRSTSPGLGSGGVEPPSAAVRGERPEVAADAEHLHGTPISPRTLAERDGDEAARRRPVRPALRAVLKNRSPPSSAYSVRPSRERAMARRLARTESPAPSAATSTAVATAAPAAVARPVRQRWTRPRSARVEVFIPRGPRRAARSGAP